LINLNRGNNLFWILHTFGWLSVLVFFLITYWVRGELSKGMSIEYTTAITISFFVTLFLRFFYRKIRIQDHSVSSLSLRVFTLAFLGGNITIWMTTLIERLLFRTAIQAHSLTFENYLALVVSWTVPIFGWSALYFGIKFWQEWMIQKEKTNKAYSLAQTAELQMLRYRMNPHFLFNTLNSIRALISEDKDSAKNMVTELSDYLRYSLVSRNYANVPFRDELESIRHYFNIQKMRYENKLDVSFDIESVTEEFPILSFLLHPLAENTIKHGLRTSPLPLKVRISAKVYHGILHIDVINSGSWIEPSDQERLSVVGTGLSSVRQRLTDAYPGKHHFEILEKYGYVHVQLALEKDIQR